MPHTPVLFNQSQTIIELKWCVQNQRFLFIVIHFIFPFDVFCIVVVLTFKEIRGKKSKQGDDSVDANIL